MRKTLPVATGLLATAVAAAALAGGTASAAPGKAAFKIGAKLTVSAEVPKPKGSSGSGTFTGTFTQNSKGGVFRWTLTFFGLTGRATAAHVHLGKPGVAGPVIVPLCGPCQSGQSSMTAIGKDVIAAFKTGRAYVNVHTTKNKAGEIRGQVNLGG